MTVNPEPKKFLDYMIDIRCPTDLPPQVYWVYTHDPLPFRRPGWIIAPRTSYRLSEDSTSEFFTSIHNHGFRAEGTPWVTVFKERKDAERYGWGCGCEFEICEVDTTGWYGKGVVVVNAPDVKRVGKGKLKSELLVHKGWEMDEDLAARFQSPNFLTSELGEKVKKQLCGRKEPTASTQTIKQAIEQGSTEINSTNETDEGKEWTIQGILADEMRYFYNDGERECHRGYLVDWSPTNGIPWKPSWNEKAHTNDQDVADYLAKKKKWKEAQEEGVNGPDLTFKEILFDDIVEVAEEGGVKKVRYLIDWEEDVAPTWLYEPEMWQKALTEYRKKAEHWQVWEGKRVTFNTLVLV